MMEGKGDRGSEGAIWITGLEKGRGQEAHVEERKKAMGVMGQVWGIGKRRFGGDWEKRIKIFKWLVGSVMGGDMGMEGVR